METRLKAVRKSYYDGIVRFEVEKLLALGSKGALRVFHPASNDERLDLLVKLSDEPGDGGVFLRVGTSTGLSTESGKQILRLELSAPPGGFPDDARMRYFFGCFSLERMAFLKPVFLVPSEVLNRVKARKPNLKQKHLTFRATMDGSDKAWGRFAYSPDKVGAYVLDVITLLDNEDIKAA